MVIKIRLARFGRTNQPIYNIVVSQARTALRSRPMEVLGTYDPIPRRDPYEAMNQRPGAPPPKAHKDIKLDITRAKYWIGVGAQPTKTAWRILSMVGILEKKKRPDPPRPLGPVPEQAVPAFVPKK
ncbi:mitochondrial ribosomal protein S16 [Sporothrix schenckii 1099-18]|uniref:Ribosomal protein S16 n=3 Tax=Sporothrix TaxID=29907 RepID=U7PMZ8_SPOS1|nr:mitochondrial ribosomal protein S16 [Sporothrix schenckii 1099-18]XP_040621749.1 mitochondrial ribosomal protein S16 [Sporothrix brasiliensis 5110]ERS96942.1 ribosomal protein S16 [Sporothrix schenckii ATCC 58251]KIH93739.1 mitochondrial ribosomal protein S16 [Sporothrix brasiliensis 5110]KJR86129.1 mitochondrial ribosomal protein S16 [Sporothrix schenckii 1099-18]